MARIVGQAAQPRPITPAGWAYLSSDGQWTANAPHLGLLAKKLAEIVVARDAGRATRTIIACPPRHGKSMLCSQYFPAYWLASFPDDRVILTAYEADFAAEWGAKAQNSFAKLAPTLCNPPLEVDPNATAASRWNIKGRTGGMQTAGAGGALLGKGANLLIIDDPIKSAEIASSETQREALWDWWISTVKTRLEPAAAVILIMQRWHEDDLAGKLISRMNEGGQTWDVVEFKGLAEENDPLGRPEGEALWPARFNREELESMRAESPHWFAAQYQQNPRPRGGAMFKREWVKDKFIPADHVPKDADRCRFWDKAASDGKGDWTASCLMARHQVGPDIKYYVEHVTRDRLSPHMRDRKILATARDDERRGPVRIRSDQDPGSAGKAEAAFFLSMLDGFDARTAPVTGNKETGFRPFASAAEGGNVYVVKAPWNDAWLDELEAFMGKHSKFDDQVDATGGAHRELSGADNRIRVGPNPLARYRGRVATDDPHRTRLGLLRDSG